MRKFWFLSVLSLFIVVMAFPIAVIAQGGDTIGYDQVVTGEITAETYEISYQFAGQADEVILVEMNATSEEPRLDSYVRLLSPSGDELAVDDDSNGNLNSLLGPFTLSETGTYTIVATRFQQSQGTSTGTFELVVKLAQITPLFLDETVTSTLDDANNFAFFEYTASADGIFDIRVDNISGMNGLNVNIVDENNNYINGFFVANDIVPTTIPFNLNAGEQVSINIRREPNYATSTPQLVTESMQVDFTLFEVNAIPVTFDEPFSGSLTDENPVDYYSFEGSAGDLVSLHGERINGDFEVNLIDAFGRQFNGMGTAYGEGQIGLDPITLSTTGTHMIVIRRMNDEDYGNITGIISDYALTLTSSQTPLLANGVEVTGTINPDGNVHEQIFRYEGTEGEVVRITLRSLDDVYVPNMDVQIAQIEEITPSNMGMDNSFYAGFNTNQPGVITYEFTLTSTTAYLFYVRGGYSPEGPISGEFGLMVERID